jgi:hypothetical protein
MTPQTPALNNPKTPHKPSTKHSSWNRQVYWWDGPDGQITHWKANDTISYNFILANYHSSMGKFGTPPSARANNCAHKRPLTRPPPISLLRPSNR